MYVHACVYKIYTHTYMYSYTFLCCRLHDVVLLVAVPATGQEVNAFGIELCHCPPQYEGLSCQNPAPGYFRKRADDFMDSSSVLDLIGISLPCQCHGHSNQCDRETGYCRVCSSDTS